MISSVGGDIGVGMDLGDFIFDNTLDLRVDGYCFSSCANYVFPAARKKSLGKHAMLGFHGGATSEDFDTSEVDSYVQSVPESERAALREKLLAGIKEYLQGVQQRETKFFEKIGVNQAITTIGQGDEYLEQAKSGEYAGWDYSIHDLEKFGVDRVSVIDPPWEPIAPSGIKVFRVRVDS